MEDKRDEKGVKVPSANQITDFWNGVIGVAGEYDPAVKTWKREKRTIPEVTQEEPDLEIWNMVLRKAKSWRAPGRDGLHAFWYKIFPRACGKSPRWC